MRETCRSIGIEFDPWQTDLNRCLLAKRADGLYAADTAVISIARQVGKTFDIGAVAFAECIAVPNTTVVWTAHRFKVARETFNELRGLAKSPKLTPHLDYDAITTAAGNEMIPFRNNSRIVFAARERGSIRGFTKVRILVLDEAQILTDAVLADLTPTMNHAENPLVILMGTPPKPSDPSEVFTRLRREALAGESDDVLYVEMSADADCDVDDREQWGKANPSYPKRTPARAILRLRKLLSAEDFAREALGIWEHRTGSNGLERWSQLADPDAERGAQVAFGVDVDPDRLASIAVAWNRPDGARQVMLADEALPAYRVAERCADLVQRWGGQVVAPPTVADELEKARVPVLSLPSAGFVAASGAFADAVAAGTVRHGNQLALNQAVKDARWRDAGAQAERAFQLKNAPTIGPLAAATRALHGLGSLVSVYSERGVRVV